MLLQHRLEQTGAVGGNADELESDMLFLKEIMESGIKKESLVIMQVMQ
jgi:hypothetical protein